MWFSYNFSRNVLSVAFGNMHSSSRIDKIPIGYTRIIKNEIQHNLLNSSNNNNNKIIIIITNTMFMVVTSRQSHWESSPGSFDEYRMAPSSRRPKITPDDSGCESACTGCQKLHPLSGQCLQLGNWLFPRPRPLHQVCRNSICNNSHSRQRYSRISARASILHRHCGRPASCSPGKSNILVRWWMTPTWLCRPSTQTRVKRR